MAKKKKEKAAKLTGFSVRADGRLMYQFKFGEKRHTVYGMTVEECMSKRDKKIKELEDGKYKSAKQITMSEYFDRWIDAKTGTVKETTIRTDTILLKRIAATVIDESGTAFGDLILTKVESQNVRDLQKALLKEVIIKEKDGKEHKRKGMKTRAANDAIYLLKSVFRTAIEERTIEWNPVTVKPLKRTEPLARDTIHRALTKQETKQETKPDTKRDTEKDTGPEWIEDHDYVFDDDGMMKSGTIVRHLILPQHTKNSIGVLELLKREFDKDILVSLMGQYIPMGRASEFKELGRRITAREYDKVLMKYEELGLDGYVQELSSAKESYVPDFDI